VTFDPLTAVGLVLYTNPDGNEVVGGSCFLYRRDEVALTAAHCIPESALNVRLLFPRLDAIPTAVLNVERHPTADLAAVYTNRSELAEPGYPRYAFWNHVGNYALGEQFFAFGFPVEGPSPDAVGQTPTPRLFIGSFQRYFQYCGLSREGYLAGEMSIPAPGGLSGGPLFRQGAQQMVTGLVTTNVESYAITDSIEEIQKDGSIYRQEARRVISYGLALMLAPVGDWLDEHVRHRPGVAWS